MHLEKSYDKHTKWSISFFKAIKDYTSLIMLQKDITAEMHLLINLESITLCFNCKFRER